MSHSDVSAAPLRRRFRRLAARLAATDWILLGTIHERRIPAPAKPGRKARTYGPYFQWTFKRAGRTVTVNLSADQVPAVRHAIRRQRAVETLLDEMRALSRRFIDATTIGVPKRKSRI